MLVLDVVKFAFNVLKFLLAISPLLLIVLIFVKNNNPRPRRPTKAFDSDEEYLEEDEKTKINLRILSNYMPAGTEMKPYFVVCDPKDHNCCLSDSKYTLKMSSFNLLI